MLSEEQASAIKQQLIEHIDRSFPEEKKQFAREQIHRMDAESLEEFLKKNNLVSGQSSECIFCSIIAGEMPSYKIDENSDAIAVLEINPVSRGHVLIIPKKHLGSVKEISKSSEELAKSISKKIRAKLKPKIVNMITSSAFGHSIINLLPIYSNETLSSKRQAAKKEELEEVRDLLAQTIEDKKENSATAKIAKTAKVASTSRSKKEKSLIQKAEDAVKKFEEKLWLPRRIP